MSNLSTYVYCVPCMIFCCIIFYCLCVPCYNFARVSCRNVKPLPESGLLWVFRLLAESSDWESSTVLFSRTLYNYQCHDLTCSPSFCVPFVKRCALNLSCPEHHYVSHFVNRCPASSPFCVLPNVLPFESNIVSFCMRFSCLTSCAQFYVLCPACPAVSICSCCACMACCALPILLCPTTSCCILLYPAASCCSFSVLYYVLFRNVSWCIISCPAASGCLFLL